MLKLHKLKRYVPGYCCRLVHSRNYNEVPLNEVEVLSDEDEYVSVIDDSRRINATICDV